MPLIECERVTLRELQPDDIPLIHRWMTDPALNRYLASGTFADTLRGTERFVEAQLAGEDPLNRSFIISLRKSGLAIGTGGCFNIDWRHRCAELGIIIGEKKLIGVGYGAEAVELLLAFGFGELDLHRIYLRVFDFNERAIQAFRKCGFIEEGRLRETYFRDGDFHDILLMAVLEQDHRSHGEGSA